VPRTGWCRAGDFFHHSPGIAWGNISTIGGPEREGNSSTVAACTSVAHDGKRCCNAGTVPNRTYDGYNMRNCYVLIAQSSAFIRRKNADVTCAGESFHNSVPIRAAPRGNPSTIHRYFPLIQWVVGTWHASGRGMQGSACCFHRRKGGILPHHRGNLSTLQGESFHITGGKIPQ
jgi:hypothetical protein